MRWRVWGLRQSRPRWCQHCCTDARFFFTHAQCASTMTGMNTALTPCRWLGILLFSLLLPPAWADQTNSPRYTFSWQLGQEGAPAPRGGTTRGPHVDLDTEPSDRWKALRESHLLPLEHDR